MNHRKQSRTRLKYTILTRLTGLLLSVITLDAVYILSVVCRMEEDIDYAMEWYHAVPIMTEHVLAAVVVYLAIMVLIYRLSRP